MLEQRISLSSNPATKGRIVNVPRPQGGVQYYEVLLDSGDLQLLGEHELQQEVSVQTAWDLMAYNAMSDYRNFAIASTLYKVRNTTANTISTLKASRTIFKPYQYKPLVKFLKSNLKRILVADEVGLGKTIEAGHIMLEHAVRGNLQNALVICTNSLRDKWKTELQDKFNFQLKKYESANELIRDIQDDINASNRRVFGVINYEKCRNEELQSIIRDNSYRFDFLICDEAHKIRNSETKQHKGVAQIVDHSDAVVFLTATPIMTDLRNLHNLIRVLDREGYDTYDIFNNAVRLNRPFIKALNKLNKSESLKEIGDALDNEKVVMEMTADQEVYSREERTIGEIFQSDQLYLRAKQNMLSGNTSVENRVRIQQDLIELNSLNHLYTRTRKKEVMSPQDMVERNPRTISVNLSPREREVYDAVINQYDNQNNLGLIQRKRQMSSCIVAFQSDRGDLEKGFYDRELPDSKFEAFKAIIQEVVLNRDHKLIVFAFFTNTLLYLKAKLQELNVSCEIIYGGVQDRTDRIENFQHDDNIKVLLSSEVGSEGLDLQFCNALVNYDLPWNPMVVEQRIGRIDRVGQRESVINIYNLIISDTIEERIHNRLYQRINLFKESLGDLEEILGDSEPLGKLISEGIEELFKTKLTEEEQNAKLNQLEMAIENNRQTLKRVEAELAESFANDIHFQNEIESITRNNRYLTKEEIIQYIESIIRIELSELRLVHQDQQVSDLVIPPNRKGLLFDFIEKYSDHPRRSPELYSLYKQFKARHIGSENIALTFDQEYAYKHKRLEYISAFHPLVNAITNYFVENKYDQNQAHQVTLNSASLKDENRIVPGFYILALYRVTVERHLGDGHRNDLQILKTVLADVNGDSVKILPSEVGDRVYGQVQMGGEKFSADLRLDKEFVNEIRYPIMLNMKENEKKIREDEEIKFRSSIRRRTEQEVNYIDSRINRIEGMLSSGQGIEAILLADMASLKQKRQRLLQNQENAKVEVGHALISANLIQIT